VHQAPTRMQARVNCKTPGLQFSRSASEGAGDTYEGFQVHNSSDWFVMWIIRNK